ncbi:hypothetical protein LCGC14_2833870 [marine sediment metagenome]|uniref:Uncharacterized protein n=1 Tax=marine sediment metagenome TaxID=412755 RepID=A0A0F8YZZ4_9ZZZZ
MNLHWDTLHEQSREEILANACINTRFAHYEWDEMELWIQQIIKANMQFRSRGTVLIIS